MAAALAVGVILASALFRNVLLRLVLSLRRAAGEKQP